MTAPKTEQVEYDEAELLASHEYAEPLIVAGVRCHGGFADDGTYVSPRTANRVPAIAAWQAKHRRDFGTELLDLPLDTWPEHYPNVAQARFLVESGIPDPISATLTRVGTVEGFGSMIRFSAIPDMRRVLDEDCRGTALAHLGTGLFEAHARDEAGHGGEGGHEHMWYAARDVAFENPVTEDQRALMLERMGIALAGSGGKVDVAAMRAAALASRSWPDDVDFDLEILITRMVRLLLIEISAFHTFAWAEQLLADPDLVAGDGEGARLVSYIRADETPHVDYLRTALSELRDRTILGEGGRKHAGADLVGATWDRALAQSIGPNRQATLETTWGEVRHAIGDRPGAADLLARFDELGSVSRRDDGTWAEAPAAA
ncbi:MAG TPA: hypothetical protein VHK25_00370 [Acidimicrobiales bacterium]|nr:hypothetical protein [Acidimicrobiales bacterium]